MVSTDNTDKRSKWKNWGYYVSALGIILTVGLCVVIVFFWDNVQEVGHYGYLGAFIISVFGGATYIAPVPMTPVIDAGL